MTLQELFSDHQLYHSEFQMDHLITIRAGGTVYGQYKQALRELYKRYRGLKELYADRELLQVDIDELAVCSDSNEFQRRRDVINLAKKRMSMEELEKNIQDTEREFNRFYAQAVALKQQVGELTPERRDQLDREMWEYKLKEMAALDLATTGRLTNNTYEFIGACPPDMRRTVLSACRQRDKLIEWFEHKSDMPLPQLPDICPDIGMLMGKEADDA